MNSTEKLYYSDPETLVAETPWTIGVEPNHVILRCSPAYPEGGGQVGDTGVIEQGEISIPFIDTQKSGIGRPIVRQDFPVITVDHEVVLKLAEPLPEAFKLDKPIVVRVDETRRRALSRSHTAAHLLWLALSERFGNLYPVVRGCHIVESGGRFDLLIERPSEQDLRDAEGFIQNWVTNDFPVEMRQLPDEPECRVWHSNGKEIPCGGTHLGSCSSVGPVNLRVKSKGKSGYRVMYEFA